LTGASEVCLGSTFCASVAAQGARNTPVTSLQLGMAASADNCEWWGWFVSKFNPRVAFDFIHGS